MSRSLSSRLARVFHRIPLGTYGLPPFRVPVTLPVARLTEHLHVIGASGTGKSRALAHLALSLLSRGEAVTLLDPHGDTARLVFTTLVARGVFADPSAHERITYLDLPAAARRGRSMAFNILEQPFDTPTTARLVLEAFRRVWPTLENGVAPAFENAVLAGVSVLVQHRLPLVFLHDLLTDASWRGELLRPITDASVRGFFARLDRWSAREQAQYLESTLRRAFLLSFSPVLRDSLGQGTNGLGPFRARFDSGRSLIVNLALPDSDTRRLIGALLAVSIEQGARQRADTPPEARGRAHTVILDEFADVSSQSGESLLRILEECRKFGVGLVLSHQSGAQLTPRMGTALGAVGTTLAFRLGRVDAEAMGRQIGSINPRMVKAAHPTGTGLPAFMSLDEQREGWTAALQRLKPRTAFVTRPKGRVARIRTLPLPDPVVDPEALERAEEWYLGHLFTPGVVVEAELAGRRTIVAPSPLVRRARRGQ